VLAQFKPSQPFDVDGGCDNNIDSALLFGEVMADSIKTRYQFRTNRYHKLCMNTNNQEYKQYTSLNHWVQR
jgi:hypothetical protein